VTAIFFTIGIASGLALFYGSDPGLFCIHFDPYLL
jgi:hypothetical protein